MTHTLKGAQIQARFNKEGKETIYNPGLITAWVFLLPLSCLAISWLCGQRFSLSGLIWGFVYFIFVAGCLILIPFAINSRVKSKRFAFPDAGHLDQLLDKSGENEVK